ncbi:DUF3891 family protein [Candidatus Poriferisocius sp.]|uniref:DUF3891 family protein n=1 Tax=Candidatus Poriferisocius sp. TaxID=3101276 RepID=UPI003B026E48
MIVQSAANGVGDASHFVIAMHQHTSFAGALAANFGNDEFSGLEPAEPMRFVVEHHDQGWADLDAAALQDPDTGLPYNLTATPLPQIVATSAASPAFNEAHHPFSGIISSMHTYGLYRGRYGLSDKIFLDLIPEDLRPEVDAMLEAEESRQRRLQGDLAAIDPDHATDEHLFHAYKQLQFFDTLSLYFHLAPQGERGDSVFPNVPRSVGEDVSVSVVEHPDGVYGLDPYPFATDGLELVTEGRYLTPQPSGTDLSAVLAATPVATQTVRLIDATER